MDSHAPTQPHKHTHQGDNKRGERSEIELQVHWDLNTVVLCYFNPLKRW